MNWNLEKQLLLKNKPKLNKNSQLKRKMNLVKKIKNLNFEDVTSLREDLINENLEQFYSEIIDSLFTIKVTNITHLKNILRILTVYVADKKFIYLLFNYKVTNYWHHLVFIEVNMMINEKYDYVNMIKRLFEDEKIENKIFYLEYILNFHDNAELLEFCKLEKEKIGKIDFSEKDVADYEKIKTGCSNIGLEIITKEPENGFKQVIVPEENEFDFYNLNTSEVKEIIVDKSSMKCENPSNKLRSSNGNLEKQKITYNSEKIYKSSKEVIELVKTNMHNISVIDEISRNLKKPENNKHLISIFIKLKKNILYIPVLARIIKNCGSLYRKTISKLIDDINSQKTMNDTSVKYDLFLITELGKFKYIQASEIFNLLDVYFQNKNTELYCYIMRNIARFYLVDEATNIRIREYLDKIIAYGNKSNDMTSIYVNEMLTKIFPKEYDTKYNDFINFIIEKEYLERKGDLFRILKANRKFAFYLVIEPWKYKNVGFLSVLSEYLDFDDILIDFILFMIRNIGDIYKMKAFSYANLICYIIKRKDMEIQENVIKNIIDMDISKEIKVKILLMIISEMSYFMKLRFIGLLKKMAEYCKSHEINKLLFNLCENIGEKYIDMDEEDSLDKEIRELSLM